MAFRSLAVKRNLWRFWEQQTAYWEVLSSEESVTSATRRRATAFVPDGVSVLDIGCGPAGNSVWLTRRCRYTGVDLSLAGLKQATGANLNLVCGDAECMPFRDGHFDAAIATFVLEHSVSPRDMLREMYRVVREAGRIILLGPAWDFPFWYPNSLRVHCANKLWRARYALTRLCLQLRGLWFGWLPFQTIDHPEALEYEFVHDADAVYIVWTYEVIRLMERWNCTLVHWEVDDPLLGSNPFIRMVKRGLRHLPPYCRAGSTVLLVFEK